MTILNIHVDAEQNAQIPSPSYKIQTGNNLIVFSLFLISINLSDKNPKRY